MSLEAHAAPYNANDPLATFVSANSFDFLLIELVPLCQRLSVREQNAEDSSPSSPRDVAPSNSKDRPKSTSSVSALGSIPSTTDPTLMPALFARLDGLGYRVGLLLPERFSLDRPRFTDALDAIKFLCKDLWQLVFRKQIDNLKTNHRGVYVLTDNKFLPLRRMSRDRGKSMEETIGRAQPVCTGDISGSAVSLAVLAPELT